MFDWQLWQTHMYAAVWPSALLPNEALPAHRLHMACRDHATRKPLITPHASTAGSSYDRLSELDSTSSLSIRRH